MKVVGKGKGVTRRFFAEPVGAGGEAGPRCGPRGVFWRGPAGWLLCGLLLVGVAGLILAQEPPFPVVRPEAPTPAEPTVVRPELAEALGPVTIADFVTLDYVDTQAEDVVNAIIRATGRNILWATGAKSETRVTVHVRNIDWRDALRMVLDQAGGVVIEETPTRMLIDTPKPITAEWVEDDLKLVIETIGRIGDASIIVGPGVEGTVTARVVNQPWTKVLEQVVRTAGFVTVREANVIRIVHPSSLQQQLVTKVFKLNYVLPPDTYRPTMKSDYLSGGPVSRADARKAMAAMGAGVAAPFVGQLGVPGAAPARAAGAPGAPRIEEVDFPLFYAIRRVLTPQIGQVTYDPDRNSLIVTDTEPVLKQLEEVLARLDTEPEQVFVDVKFVTVGGPAGDNVTDLLEFGVDWSSGLWASHSGPSFNSLLPWSHYRPGRAPGPTGFTPGVLDFSSLQTILQLLKTDANAEVVQAPKLTVLDHNEATIFVGETIRFAKSTAVIDQAGGLTFAYEEADNSPVDAGFQILIVPHIVPGSDKVILTLIPQRNTFDGYELFGTGEAQIKLPQVSSDTVVTKMLLRDKETAVIGGLIDEQEGETVRKVPFLGDIPFLGWVFKRQSVTKVRRNLIIFVTVRIIHRPENLRDVYGGYEDYDLVSTEYFTPFDLERRQRAEGALAKVGEVAEKVAPIVEGVAAEVKEAPPVAEQPGWQKTPEGIEYSVPAKGAEEKPEEEIELE